ncbi:Flp pilus assembly complex ATPase component TadA, partial [Candidatus Parcubacteria bacterium]|nr:Flp pilus assembly complex ATPase component TadA [Candidatus Parcubacteria bacterium]
MEEKRKLVGELDIEEKKWKEIREKVKNVPEMKVILEKYLEGDISDLFKIIMGGAINVEASDIHFEPLEGGAAKMRLRIDGLLQDVFVFPAEVYNALVSRIKLVSGMKINIFDRPQDGRFSVRTDVLIEIRVSSLPAEYGETIVMR